MDQLKLNTMILQQAPSPLTYQKTLPRDISKSLYSGQPFSNRPVISHSSTNLASLKLQHYLFLYFWLLFFLLHYLFSSWQKGALCNNDQLLSDYENFHVAVWSIIDL